MVVYGVTLDAGGLDAARERGRAGAPRYTQNLVGQSRNLPGYAVIAVIVKALQC